MPSINSINYCPNCGSKRIENANFCLECGYELKLLEEILVKHDSMQNSNEEQLENNIISDNSTENSYNDLIENTDKSYTTNNKESNRNFEVIRPNTEEINEKEDEKPEIESNVTNNTNKKENNFNLVRPNSHKNSEKKPKIKKNFSILNQKKI